MADAKISELTPLSSSADLGQLYIPLFKADGSPDNARILASTMFQAVKQLTIASAWSGTGTATTPLLVNVTADPGPANAASKLLDLQVGGSSLAHFLKGGPLVFPGSASTTPSSSSGIGNWFGSLALFGQGMLASTISSTTVNIALTHNLAFNQDLFLNRDAADILAQRRGTNGNTFKVYRTFTSSSTFERGTFGWHDSSSDTGVVGTTLRIGTEKGSVGGTARAVAVITDGTARVTYGASGGQTMAEGHNTTLGTTTGSKIGTATNEKLGFWNATPVVQQVLATGAGATVDNVITLLQTLGLCKQS